MEFEEPPVSEVAVGVQFEPLPELGPLQCGAFWNEVRAEYPETQLQPALQPQIERLDDGQVQLVANVIGIGVPPIRSWLITADGSKLLQLQNDRFIHNWRKLRGGQEYPRYSALEGAFAREWGRFESFLLNRRIAKPSVVQAELTYVNSIGHLPLEQVTPWFKPASADSFLAPEPRTTLAVQHLLPERRGRLFVVFQPAALDGALQLTITVRGDPRSSASMMSWFDVAHACASRAFLAYTNVEMHARWKRVNQ